MDMAIAFFGAAAIFFLAAYSLRFVYDYRIRNESVEIVLFRIAPIYRIPINSIESIKVATWRELGVGFFTLRFGNRFTITRMVLIEKQGLQRRVVITPDDPHAFVSEVQRIRAAGVGPNNSFKPKPLRGSA